jgi:phospholipid transport system substrate-binding protein
MMQVVLVWGALAAAVPATDALKAREAEVRKLVPPTGQPVTPALRKQLGETMTQAVDLERMAAASLGESFSSLNAAKRKQYVDVFAQRFRRISAEQVDLFRSNAIKYLPEEPGADGRVKVPTEVKLDDDTSRIVYVMHLEKDHWHIEDLVVDGVSTVDNFKRAFTRVMGQEGFDGLIARLKKESAPAEHP